MAAVTLSAGIALLAMGGVVMQRQAVARRTLAERGHAFERLEVLQARCARGELPSRDQLQELEGLFGGARLDAERRGDAVYLVFAGGRVAPETLAGAAPR